MNNEKVIEQTRQKLVSFNESRKKYNTLHQEWKNAVFSRKLGG